MPNGVNARSAILPRISRPPVGDVRSMGTVVPLDYRKAISLVVRGGSIREVRLRIPAGTDLPGRIKAYVITDVSPLAEREL